MKKNSTLQNKKRKGPQKSRKGYIGVSSSVYVRPSLKHNAAFKTWVRTNGGVSKTADILGTKQPYVSQLLHQIMRPSLAKAVEIEKRSLGKVPVKSWI